ncbi:30S ribosomal protein S8 [bacterium]|nr:30S ribosomal protein S8 [bacterium]
MAMTDPIADMLTRIRNANKEFHEKVDIPASKVKRGITEILKEEGYIANYKHISDRKQGILRVYLKYTLNKSRVIKKIKRISRPGLRIYKRFDQLPKVLGGLGTAIISTSKGLMTDEKARQAQIGGEVICYIW